MVVLNENEKNKISGFYKPYHKIEPIEIEKGVYILHDEIVEIKELKGKLPIKVKKFNPLGKNINAIKYKKFLSLQVESIDKEIITKTIK